MNDQQQSTAASGNSSKSCDNENDNTNADSSSKISDSELFPEDDSGSKYVYWINLQKSQDEDTLPTEKCQRKIENKRCSNNQPVTTVKHMQKKCGCFSSI
jgi:hypothetical protein